MHIEVAKFILVAGEMLLTSGAEVYRAEETMERMGAALGYNVEAFVTPTGILLTVSYQGEFFTKVRRIRYRTQNLGRIAGVNAISRGLSLGTLTFEEAKIKLQELRVPAYSIWQKLIAVMVASGSLTFILGGSGWELIIAALSGLIAYSVGFILERYNANSYLSSSLASFLVANCVYTAQILLPDISAPTVLVGGLMVLVPGVAMASAVKDIVQGELLSGTSRAVEAIAIAGALAAGSAIALGLWR